MLCDDRQCYNRFNPRSPCGERRVNVLDANVISVFQSTLPVWGATTLLRYVMRSEVLFQSTLPVWGATCPNR